MNTTTWASKAAGILSRCALAAAYVIAPLAGWAQSIIDLGSKSQYTWIDMNDSGQILGWDVASGAAVIYAGGLVMTLQLPSGSGVSAIANNGAVAGWVRVDNVAHAAVFQDATVRDVGTLAGPPAWSAALAINDSGQVAGIALPQLSGGVQPPPHAFAEVNGSMTDIHPPGAFQSNASDINNAGQVVGGFYMNDGSGNHSFFYSSGTIRDIGAGTNATALNDAGQVVGSLMRDAVQHPFLYFDGQLTDLFAFADMAGMSGDATDINARGQVVGNMSHPSSIYEVDYQPFVYADGVMTNLNAYAGASGWALNLALDIDSQGAILGTGMINGESHYFLMTPVPEASTTALLGVGLMGLWIGAWRRRKVREGMR